MAKPKHQKAPAKTAAEEAIEELNARNAPPAKKHPGLLARVWPPASLKAKVLLGVTAVVVVAGVLLAVPYSRYGFLGQVIKRDITVTITDSRTHKPVSDMVVETGRQKVKTDAKGEAHFKRVPVGDWELVGNKKYYNLLDTHIMVPL